MIYTSDDLIASVKRNAVIPASQRKFSDDDFLALLNEELQLMLTGELMKLNEDFFTTQAYVPLVANQSMYEFPINSAGWRLRDLGWLDPVSLVIQNLPRIPYDYIDRYQYSPSDKPLMFLLSDSNIVTVPEMGGTVTGGLLISYERLQNKLIKSAECGHVTSVAAVPGGYQLGVNSLPIGYSLGVDVISGTNPHGLLIENEIPAVAPLLLTITGIFNRVPVVGDWVAQTGNTPIAHIPPEYNIILAQLAALRYAVASGDDKAVGTMTMSIQAGITKLRERSLNRVKGAPMKIRTKDRVLNLMRGRMW